MPLLSLTAKNTALDALSVDFLSLHSQYSATGSFEVAGGTPAYARLAATFSVAGLGTRQLIGGPYNFDIPATEVDWIGLWTAGGAFLGMTPNGGGALQPFTGSGSTITSPNHGFVLNSALVIWRGAGAIQAGLFEGATYWVVAFTVDTLQVSAFPAGAAISFSLSGSGFLQGIVPTLSANQSVFPITALTLDANMAA